MKAAPSKPPKVHKVPAAVKDMETRTAEAQQKQLERQAMLREERRRSQELAMESYATITYAGGMYGELRSCLDPTPLTRERPKSAGAVVSGGFRSKRFMEAPPPNELPPWGGAGAAGAGAAGARSSAAHIASTIGLIYPSTSPMLRPGLASYHPHRNASTRRSPFPRPRSAPTGTLDGGRHARAPDVGAGTRQPRPERPQPVRQALRAGFVWFLHRRHGSCCVETQLRCGPRHSRQARR